MKLLVLIFVIILKTQMAFGQKAEEGMVVSKETVIALTNFIANNNQAHKWECTVTENGLETALTGDDHDAHLGGVISTLKNVITWETFYASKSLYVGYHEADPNNVPPELDTGKTTEISYQEFKILVNKENNLILEFEWSRKSKKFESIMTGSFAKPQYTVQNTQTKTRISKRCILKD